MQPLAHACMCPAEAREAAHACNSGAGKLAQRNGCIGRPEAGHAVRPNSGRTCSKELSSDTLCGLACAAE
eukprot:4547472-Alexandrium_andersonii.AAC.1